MFNKTEYWLELCDDDIPVAKAMLQSKNYLWMGFICHLITEKALKAAMASITDEMPKIHHLLKLANMAQVNNDLSELPKKSAWQANAFAN